MFFKFLKTKQVRLNFGFKFIDSVTKFVKFHAEPYEKNFTFYLRIHKLHYDEYTKSIHEGTNNALISSSIEIGPSIQINKSCEIMCVLSHHKYIQKRKSYKQNFHGNKVYSSLKCSNLLVKEGYFILEI